MLQPVDVIRKTDEAAGYVHHNYAASLAEFGVPVSLPQSGGWLLRRPIEGTSYYDAMGCYPLFGCQDWSKLHIDLDALGEGLVSVALVADPFGNHHSALLHKCFPDWVIPFKEHLVTDLSRPRGTFVNPQHRRKARKALARINVECCADPALFIDEWINLYGNLVQRHSLRGLPAFSATSFETQVAVPGISMFRAVHRNRTIAMTLWYTDRNVAYYHLGASSKSGYELAASFGLFWVAIEYFAGCGLQWLDLGAGAGLSRDLRSDGLTRFKRGWATGTRTAYLCGRVFDHTKYAEVMSARQVAESDYFPGYRKGEFG